MSITICDDRIKCLGLSDQKPNPKKYCTYNARPRKGLFAGKITYMINRLIAAALLGCIPTYSLCSLLNINIFEDFFVCKLSCEAEKSVQFNINNSSL